jgi:dienelactone hydrolase
MSSRRWKFGLIAVLATAMAGWMLVPYAASAAFVLDLAGSTNWMRRVLPVRVRQVTSRDVSVTTRHGMLAARLYEPVGGAGRYPFIVFPGVHSGGVDEPRLVAFSRRLAATGTAVLSVPLPDLREFRITPRTTDMIEDAAAWLSEQHTLAPNRRVGLAAVSFAGGLALVAAGRPALRDRLQVVVSLGGHADLPRTMRYLCTGRLPDGGVRPPHDYGVAIILLGAVDRVVPREQAPALQRAILTFLEASSEDTTNPPRSQAMFADARRQGEALPEPASQLMKWVVARDVSALGERLLPFIEELGGAAELSPARSPAPHVPVFLLHGDQDNVIPSTETTMAAAYLESQGNRQVRALLTPLVTHANLSERIPVADAWRLVRFWKELLSSSAY